MLIVTTIDKDNDFGRKTSFSCPIIGFEDIERAIIEFGYNDPEDSDINAALATLKIAKEKGGTPVIICGTKKFGSGTYEEIMRQAEYVKKKLGAEKAIIVTDGAEDDTVIPIISQIFNIVDVYHVTVKQLPGVEKTGYIIVKYLKEWFGSPKLKKLSYSVVGIYLLVYGIMNILSLRWPNLPHYFNTVVSSIIFMLMGFFVMKEVVTIKVNIRKILRYAEYVMTVIAVLSGIFIVLDVSRFTTYFTQDTAVHSLVWSIILLVTFIVIEKYIVPKDSE